VLPWLPQLAEGPLGDHAVQLATSVLPNPDTAGVVPPSYVWGSVDLHLGWGLVAASLACSAWAAVFRQRVALTGLLWGALLVLASYPSLIGLGVTGVLKDFTVAIGLYVPAGLLIGGCLGDATRRLEARRGSLPLWVPAVVAALALGLALKDARVVVAENAYLAAADLVAIDWIEANTDEDAVFLVGTVPAFGDTIVVGEDAGWWLPLLAARRATAPPATVGTELGYDDYRVRLNRLSELWHDDLDSPATRAALEAENVTHAFVGTRSSRLSEMGIGGELEAKLEASPNWRMVYDQGGAKVYEYLVSR
jgi:hypothetical protein